MTLPFEQPEESYQTLRQRWLAKYLLVEDKATSAIRGILFDASQDAFKQISALEGKDGIGAATRISQLGSFMRIVRDIDASVFKDIGPVLRDGQQDSAEAAVDAFEEHERSVAKRLFPAVRDRDDWYASQRNSAALGVNHAIQQYLGASEPLSRRVYKSRSLSNGYIERVVRSQLAVGASARDIAKRVREHINPSTPGGVSYAAMRLGRTELNNAFHATTISLMADRPWIDNAVWNLSKRHDFETGCKCEEYAKLRTFPVGRVPRKPHPQCFSGEALVTAESVRAVSKRRYRGSLVDVFLTEDSPQLTGTPNHPALTKRGWVALSELREGDYVAVDCTWGDPVPIDGPNNNYVKTRIEDVFKSFSMSLGVTTSFMPQSPEQFHGDGTIGENVDIVLSNGLLQNGGHGDIFGETPFFVGDSALTDFSRDSNIDSMLQSLWPAGSDVSHESPVFALLGGHNRGGFGIGSQSFADSLEHAPDLILRAGKGFGSFGESKSTRIEFKRIVRVVNRPGFDGHVYNLETESGAYITDSIVTHNCRCFTTPQLIDFQSFERNLQIGMYDGYITR